MKPQLALNAAAVKAAQDPKRKGAEKPRLKGLAERMRKMSGYESVTGDASVDPAIKKTLAMTAPVPLAQVASGPAVPKLAGDASVANDQSVAAAMKETQQREGQKAPAPAAVVKTGPAAPKPSAVEKKAADNEKVEELKEKLRARMTGKKKETDDKDEKKEASLDVKFAADLHQVVGLDVPEADPRWERPDVGVEGQTTDRIDDHFLSWMRAKNDEDVVKEASNPLADVQNLMRSGKNTAEDLAGLIGKHARAGKVKGALGALAATAALGGAAYGGHQIAKHHFRKKLHALMTGEKTAAIVADPENDELLARLRRRAQGGLDVTSVDA